MKNLSSKKLDVNMMLKINGSPVDDFCDYGFEGVKRIRTDKYGARNVIETMSGDVLQCCNRGTAEIYKITDDFFAGCECVYISDGNEARVSIIHNEGVFSYPATKKPITMDHVDTLMELGCVVSVMARKLKTYDLSRDVQEYEIMAQRLPKAIWKNPEFQCGVIEGFLEKEGMYITGCNEQVKKYLNIKGIENMSLNYLENMMGKTCKEVLAQETNEDQVVITAKEEACASMIYRLK